MIAGILLRASLLPELCSTELTFLDSTGIHFQD